MQANSAWQPQLEVWLGKLKPHTGRDRSLKMMRLHLQEWQPQNGLFNAEILIGPENSPIYVQGVVDAKRILWVELPIQERMVDACFTDSGVLRRHFLNLHRARSLYIAECSSNGEMAGEMTHPGADEEDGDDEPVVSFVLSCTSHENADFPSPFSPLVNDESRSERSSSVVPSFTALYASRADMSAQQQIFYDSLRRRLDRSKYPDVEGNASYLFCYARDLIIRGERRGFDGIAEQLLNLGEAYHKSEESLMLYCRMWAYDCYLRQGRDEEYLALTEPTELFRQSKMETTQRLNAAFRLGQPASAVDLFRLIGCRATAYTKKHPAEFRDYLTAVFDEETAAHPRRSPWLQRLKPTKTYTHYLFSGSAIWPNYALENYDFGVRAAILAEIKVLTREAENRLRAQHQVPRVGEGWVGETALFHSIAAAFPETQVIPHGRPNWLGRQHFDIWLPRWKIAVEYHGAQHFAPIEFFGGANAFVANQERDARKVALCIQNNVQLIVAVPSSPHTAVESLIRRLREERPPAALHQI